jgi:hypothetical protein
MLRNNHTALRLRLEGVLCAYKPKATFKKRAYRPLLRVIDIRDILVFGGLGLLGYGLWLLRPWIGFAVTGAVLMGIGYLMRDE